MRDRSLTVAARECLKDLDMDQEKRHHRQLKRSVKRAGTKKVRQQLKRNLTENPEEAANAQIDYGRDTSSSLNGNDRDLTRRRETEGSADS